MIAQAWRYFPKGTIHVIVVDPGVGSARRPILAEAGGQYFIAPDNGVLSMIYDAAPHKVRVITNPKVIGQASQPDISWPRCFRARGRASGRAECPAAKFGKLIADYVRSFLLKPERIARHCWTGTVLKVDRFGNLITNLHIDDFADVKTRPIELRVGLERIHRLALTYAETAIGEVFAIVGSSGYIEIAANQASAAKKLGCGAGAPVELEIFYE